MIEMPAPYGLPSRFSVHSSPSVRPSARLITDAAAGVDSTVVIGTRLFGLEQFEPGLHLVEGGEAEAPAAGAPDGAAESHAPHQEGERLLFRFVERDHAGVAAPERSLLRGRGRL